MTYRSKASGRAVKPTTPPPPPSRAARPAGVPRFLQSRAAAPVPGPSVPLGRSGDALEREADAAARHAVQASAAAGVSRAANSGISPSTQPGSSPPQARRPSLTAPALPGLAQGSGTPLPTEMRQPMEQHFNTDLGHVRLHAGRSATTWNQALHARAFTLGSDIYLGSGQSAGDTELMAHELAHVVQQSGGSVAAGRAGALSARGGTPAIQRADLNGSFGLSNGGFEMDMRMLEGGVSTPPTQSGFDGYIRFVPGPDAPNSNQINMVQIVKLTNPGGVDVAPATLPAAQAPRGALGDPGLATKDDAAKNVEGGFYTDVHHQPNTGGPVTPPGAPLSPNFPFQPAAPGTTGTVGVTPQPAQYGSGIGGRIGQTPGFKRSSDPADIRSAALYDTPGIASAAVDLDFRFESVARSEDTLFNYGSMHWGFDIRSGRVLHEFARPVDTASATFDEALERHRDFYVHEPVTFYFDFDSDTLGGVEASKIDTLLAYLGRNPTVLMSLQGFADQVGGASAYNVALSRRRALAVRAEMVARGVSAARIDAVVGAAGASTAATTDAGTGDQLGSAALGADQSRDANRQMNRRVLLTFRDPAPAAPAPAPVPAPGP